MLPDDVFREKLEKALVELEAWAEDTRDSAEIAIAASGSYWRMAVVPVLPLACPFELLIKADQTFDISLDGEVHENKPIERLDLFLSMARAIADGRAERITTRNALTGVLLEITMRLELADGLDWIGTRQVPHRTQQQLEAAEVRRSHRYLAYRR